MGPINLCDSGQQSLGTIHCSQEILAKMLFRLQVLNEVLVVLWVAGLANFSPWDK